MFTGIIEELGVVSAVDVGRIRFEASNILDDAAVGASVAVSGCCLTVVGLGDGWWEGDVSDETLRRSTLGSLRTGDRVNLERPVRLSDRLGGHLVQGHVDGVGEIVRPAPDLDLRAPEAIWPYLVEKGSVTVDGVSLTVVDVLADRFTVAIVPHTSATTTLGLRAAGDQVNLEADVIAKYTERLLGMTPATSTTRPD